MLKYEDIHRKCRIYSRISPMKTTAIRHSNIYGPFDKYDLERSHFFVQQYLRLCRPRKVLPWGTGEEKRDLLYVDDLMTFVGSVIDKQTHQYRLYNCGLGVAYSVKSIIDLIIQASGKQLSVEQDLSSHDKN